MNARGFHAELKSRLKFPHINYTETFCFIRLQCYIFQFDTPLLFVAGKVALRCCLIIRTTDIIGTA